MSENNGNDFFGGLEERSYEFDFRKVHYVLREPSEDCVLQYRLQQMVNHRPSTDDGKIMFDPESVAKAQRILVAGSLFQGDKPVPPDTIKTWPYRVTEHLYHKARQFADLEKEDIDASKKVPDATEPISPLPSGSA